MLGGGGILRLVGGWSDTDHTYSDGAQSVILEDTRTGRVDCNGSYRDPTRWRIYWTKIQ